MLKVASLVGVWVSCPLDSQVVMVLPKYSGVGQGRKVKVGLRLRSQNVGSLTGKAIELVKILHQHSVGIACIQETKLK